MTDKRKRYDDSYSPVFDVTPEGGAETMGVDNNNNDKVEVRTQTSESPSDVKNRRNSEKRVNERGGTKSSGKNQKNRKSSDNDSAGEYFRRIYEAFTSQTSQWLAGIFIGGFGIYLLVTFLSYFTNCIKDQAAITNSAVGTLPSVGNAGGEGGARLAEFFINEGYGVGSFVLILWLMAISMKLLAKWPKFKTVNFTIKCLVAFITVSLIVGLLTLSFNSPVNWGGYHGRYVNEFIIGFVGWIGGVILCLMMLSVFVVICLRDLVNWILRKRKEMAEKRRAIKEEREEQRRREEELEEMRRREVMDEVISGEGIANSENEVFRDENMIGFAAEEAHIDPSVESYSLDDEQAEESDDNHLKLRDTYSMTETGNADSVEGNDDKDISGNDLAPDCVTREEDREGMSGDESKCEESDGGDKMIVNVNQIAKTDTKEDDNSLIKKMYKFPSPLFLKEGEHRITVDIAEQQANKERIRETLLYHKIPITSIEATVGPTVTLYEVRPEQGVKIAKIKNLADDIALSLAANGVRIIAPIPGKGTVGIEVANNEPQTVSMRTIIMSRKYNETRYKLPVALGSTIGNDVYIADLTKMPHLLVAGATGQGKSVGLNAIIASLLYKKRPDELKFVMIDPKEVEFSLYAKIEQHYLAKIEGTEAIVTDMNKVVETLQSLCVEMDNRYKLLRKAGVRNLEEYNAKIAQHLLHPKEGHRFLPYIVLIVDEFADLIMTSGKEVERPIARLAQKARAIGIHVIIATQRPSTNVITGIIKANFPVRIAFKVSSGVDSKTILDATGAQSLIGKGDMLISMNSEMVRVQCAFIDTPEVEEICNYIERQPFNAGPYLLPEPRPDDADGVDYGGDGSHGGAGELDELFAEVGEMVVTSGVGSTSGIQRRFSIGYNRAGKIMDQLEHYGVVGPSLGGKPRQVLMDMYGFQELIRNLG